MSYRLEKPYTNFERADFVVEYNHKKGLKIEEGGDGTLYALEVNEIMQNGEPIVDINYETKQAKVREDKFNLEFFNTSLGFVKRKVTMKDGTIKDFLTDILPLLQVDIPIITYNVPDFRSEALPKQNVGVLVTEHFLNECKQQVFVDYYGN